MAHRIKSVETKETLNVSHDYATSPPRVIPDPQGGNTQAAAGALVDDAETQVVPESYEYSTKPAVPIDIQLPEDFNELYDATPRKSSQKVPLKPAHLPQIENNAPPLHSVAKAALTLTHSSPLQKPAVTASRQSSRSSDQNSSSNCFTTVGSATFQTEAMTSAVKAGKLPTKPRVAGGAVDRLRARRGHVVEEASGPVPHNVNQHKVALQHDQKTTKLRKFQENGKRRSDDSKTAAATKRTNAPTTVTVRPVRGEKRTRGAAAQPPSSCEPSQPVRKKLPRASKTKGAIVSQSQEDEEPDDSQRPSKLHRMNPAKPESTGNTPAGALIISDGYISSPMPDDIPEETRVPPAQAAPSKAAPPITPAPAPVRSSPPNTGPHGEFDDTIMFDQAARSSKKVNLINFSKAGPRNQGVLQARTSGPHSRSTAPPNSKKTLAPAKEELTSVLASQRTVKGWYNPKSSGVAADRRRAQGDLHGKSAHGNHDFPEVDDEDSDITPLPPHARSQNTADQRETAHTSEVERSEMTHTTSAKSVQTTLRDALVTPAPQAQPSICAQPPAKREAARLSRQFCQGMQTVDIVGSPVPQGMGIEDPTRTVLETFSQQEAGVSSEHVDTSLTVHLNEQQEALSSNVKAVPASPRAESTALTTMKASKTKSKAMLARDNHALKLNDPFHINEKPEPRTLKLEALPSKLRKEPGFRSHEPEPPVERVLPHTARPSSNGPIIDGHEDDIEMTLVDHGLTETTLINHGSTKPDLIQWAATLRPYQLNLFESMVECAQKLTEYMVEQEKGNEEMINEHYRRTMFLIDQEEKHRAREYAMLQRTVRARKEERVADAREYSKEMLAKAGEFEREMKQQKMRATAWDAANDDVKAFIEQYS